MGNLLSNQGTAAHCGQSLVKSADSSSVEYSSTLPRLRLDLTSTLPRTASAGWINRFREQRRWCLRQSLGLRPTGEGLLFIYILLLFFIQLYHFVGTGHLAYQPIRPTCPTCRTCPTCPTQRASDKPRGLEYMQYHWCNFAQIYMQ